MVQRKFIISSAGNRKSLTWASVTVTLEDFFARLRAFTRGTETQAEYIRMSKAEQAKLKDCGGFVAGSLDGGRRKSNAVTGRCMVTLDFDSCPAWSTNSILETVRALGRAFCVYSTRKHKPEAPRLRVIIPTDRTMTPDEYEPCARRMAGLIGIDMADPTTFEVARLMYWPSCSADAETVYEADAEKPLASVDGMLATYADWRDVSSWPGISTTTVVKKIGAKQDDPLTKAGVVGAFCRTYDVYRAIDELIPGTYTATDDGKDRFTYANGSTTGGAVVYEDGKFLYSHHATDPCSGRLVNAFDLVRLHKFGDLDDKADPETPMNRLPSYRAMCKYAANLADVRSTLFQESHEAALEDFKSIAEAEKEDASWHLQLTCNPQTGYLETTISNYELFLEHAPELRGHLYFDGFADQARGIAPLPWGGRATMPAGQSFVWRDADDAGLRAYFERIFHADAPGKILAAVELVLARHQVNEVRDFLDGISWDGKERLDTLFIDYLGAVDDAYTRAVTRKAFTAAVARAMNPGCKFDNMLILCGRQGLGKSTILDKMSRGFFNDSIRTFEGKEAAELLQNVWLVEVAELDAFRRSDVACIKQFLSLRVDRYRAAYGHRVAEHPRRCVFFGTCNTADFLRDQTGNRRFWPVDVGVNVPTKSPFSGGDLDDEIEQIWAEAKARWQMGEELFLSGEVEKVAIERQALHTECDELDGLIAEFAERDVPSDWNDWEMDKRRLYWAGQVKGDTIQTVKRTAICTAEIACELLNIPVSRLAADRSTCRRIGESLRRLGWAAGTPRRVPLYGSQRLFRRP